MKEQLGWLDVYGNYHPDVGPEEVDLNEQLAREKEAYNKCHDEHAAAYHAKRIKQFQAKLEILRRRDL